MTISKRTRQRFGNYCSDNGVLREIEEIFEAEGFVEKTDHISSHSGQRRSLVEAFHANIDVADPVQAHRLLRVYAEAIQTWGRNYPDGSLKPDARSLIQRLQADGAAIDDDGKPTGTAPTTVTMPLGRFERIGDPGALEQHLRRISDGIASDPAAAIGASKELVESVCKYILDDFEIEHGRKDDLLDLYRKVADALDLNRSSVPDSAKGSQAAQKILQNIATAVQCLAELRNELGWGHGRTVVSPALARHGRLAANAARTVGEFLLDTWHVRPRKLKETS